MSFRRWHTTVGTWRWVVQRSFPTQVIARNLQRHANKFYNPERRTAPPCEPNEVEVHMARRTVAGSTHGRGVATRGAHLESSVGIHIFVVSTHAPQTKC